MKNEKVVAASHTMHAPMLVQPLSNIARTAYLVIGALVLIPGIDLGRAGLFGRGGVFAVSIAMTFVAAGAVLFWAGASGKTRTTKEINTLQLLCWSAAIAVVGYECIEVGIALSPPGSQFPGLIGLLAAPFYWVSIAVTLVTVLAWVGIRIWPQRSSQDTR